MPNISDHVSFLSSSVGPRPSGTEEEQQAALYITEQLQKEAGLSTLIEDFNVFSMADLPRALCCAVTLIISVIALFVPVMGIPAIIVTIIAAVVFALESFDRPVVSKLLARGVSQNVVAKYEPGYDAEASSLRRRKVVLVAHYDSGKVCSEVNGPLLGMLPLMKWMSLGAMVFIPLFLIVRNMFLLHAVGAAAAVLNVVEVIALILAILPLAGVVVHRIAPYNAGANCNASGVAVLLDVATRVGRGRVPDGEEPTVHGEDAARAEGLVPDGAQIVYETPENAAPKGPEPAPQSAEARLAAAKAAVAALSGRPVTGAAESYDISEKLVQMKDSPAPVATAEAVQAQRAEIQAAFAPATDADDEKSAANVSRETFANTNVSENLVSEDGNGEAGANTSTVADENDVPAWFKAAQEKAKRPKDSGAPVHRSRYADALDAAVQESSQHFKNANDAVVSETEQRLQQMRESIMEVKAPGFEDRVEDVPTSTDAPSEAEEASELAAVATAASPDISGDKELESSRAREKSFANVSRETFAAAREELAAAEVTDEPTPRIPAWTEPSLNATTAIPPIDVSDLREAPAPFVAPVVAEAKGAAPSDASTPKEDVPALSLKKQPAPLAERPKPRRRRQLAGIPSIEDAAAEKPAAHAHPAALSLASLRQSLPSLSGTITREKSVLNESTSRETPREQAKVAEPVEAEEAPSQRAENVSRETFVAVREEVAESNSFAPVDEEIFEGNDPAEIYVDDVDDSAYDGNITETGAFAGPGYVDMPKSRVHRFFDKFSFGKHKKEREDEQTPQEWLDVDESFDAREIGAQRGGWESFRNEEDRDGAEDSYDASYDETSPYYEDEPYEDEEPAVEPIYDAEKPSKHSKAKRRWNGGAFSRRLMGRANIRSGEEDEPLSEDDPIAEQSFDKEVEQIYHFHNPDINTEVWFVALGSELAGNAGMRAFLSEHAQELRGAIIVDLEALGAGTLSLVEREGSFRLMNTSSRMKRYVKKATQATGISVASTRIGWRDSAASFAAKQGMQTMHLVGMDGVKPALLGQHDDVEENVDVQTLVKRADFVMELIKNI